MENTNSKASTSNTCEQEDLTQNARTGINDNNTLSNDVLINSNSEAENNRRQKTPFTDLSQVDADLALARTLQEQVFFNFFFACFLFFFRFEFLMRAS